MKKILWFILLSIGISLNAENILLSHRGGVYYVPGILNDKVQVEFVVDSGASMVYMPNSIFEQLKANDSIKKSDILGKGKSQIANGDIVDILIVNIQKLKIGQTEIENVKAGVGGNNSGILLGQSALKRLEPWSLDTKRGILNIKSTKATKKVYVSSSEKIGRSEALGFIHHYLSLENSRSIDGVVSLYASEVDYLDKGDVPIESISAQKEKFFRKWNKVQIDMIKLIETKESAEYPSQMTIKYSAAYNLHSDFSQQGKTGQTLNTLILKKSDASIKIISEKVKILSENSY